MCATVERTLAARPVRRVAEFAQTCRSVLSKDSLYMCSEPGQEQIKSDIQEHNLTRVVVASCSPRLHEPTFRATCEAAVSILIF